MSNVSAFPMSAEKCRKAAEMYTRRAELQEELEQLDSNIASFQSSNGQAAHVKRGRPAGVHVAKAVVAEVVKAKPSKVKAKAKGEIATFKTSGKGRKQCPECSTYVAARSVNCVCGYAFKKGKVATKAVSKPAKKDKPAKKAKKETAEKNDQTKSQVLIDIFKTLPEGGKHGDIVEAFVKSGYKTDATPASLNTMVSNELSKLVKSHIVVKDSETRMFHLAKHKKTA